MRRIVRFTLAFLILGVAVGIVISLSDQPIGYGIIIGSSVSLGFFLVTALVALQTATSAPERLAVVVLSSWLLKLIVLIALLAWLQNQDFYDRVALFLTLTFTTVLTLIADALISVKTKVPYVE